ncbi:MAG: AMP-binding protein [Anaerovoracaceae bacterium]
MGRIKNRLDIWIENIICPGRKITRDEIESYQWEKIKETVDWARSNSPFYKEKYEGYSLETREDFAKLPFISAKDVQSKSREMVCVGQNEISRIVTLQTSGTTDLPKRIYFTPEDQGLTLSFFHEGMQLFVDKSDKVMILMPCKRPGSIGKLLETGIEEYGGKTISYGLPQRDMKDGHRILEIMEKEKVAFVVALPSHMAALADMSKGRNISLKGVLLSAEYVSFKNRQQIDQAWKCKIYEHYGMTEMGLGGAVSCGESSGYHLRENDLYVEIINPLTGKVVPDGEYGEVVFTTLTRRGMPFIRYKTGDKSRWLNGICPCGSILRRLDRIGDREEKGKKQSVINEKR